MSPTAITTTAAPTAATARSRGRDLALDDTGCCSGEAKRLLLLSRWASFVAGCFTAAAAPSTSPAVARPRSNGVTSPSSRMAAERGGQHCWVGSPQLALLSLATRKLNRDSVRCGNTQRKGRSLPELA